MRLSLKNVSKVLSHRLQTFQNHTRISMVNRRPSVMWPVSQYNWVTRWTSGNWRAYHTIWPCLETCRTSRRSASWSLTSSSINYFVFIRSKSSQCCFFVINLSHSSSLQYLSSSYFNNPLFVLKLESYLKHCCIEKSLFWVWQLCYLMYMYIKICNSDRGFIIWIIINFTADL